MKRDEPRDSFGADDERRPGETPSPPGVPPGGDEPPREPPPEPPPGTPPPAPRGGPPPESAASGVPWEERQHLGFAEGLFRTLRESLMRPTPFFRSLPPEGPTPPPPLGPIGSPILYSILVGVPSLIVGLFWQFLASSIGIMEGEGSEAIFHLGFVVLFACMAPIMIPIMLLIWSAILHLFLILLGGASASFLATFRTVAYASGPQIFEVIPLCGGLISTIWGLVISVIGLREVHRTTTGRAVGAVLLPGLLCCGFFVTILVMIGVFAAAAD